MELFGVIGNPISHSLSHVMHNAAFQDMNKDAIYVPMHVEEPDLAAAIYGARALGFTGINVTVPYKEQVVPYLTSLTPEASKTQSVNTVLFTNNEIIGHSTDGAGFAQAVVNELDIKLAGKRFLILGAGGAARAIIHQLAEENCQLIIANRTRHKAEQLAQEINPNFANQVQVISLEQADLAKATATSEIIVNTTSVGMEATIDQSPLPVELLLPQHSVVDIIYNPQESNLLAAARKLGCQTRNGVGMLVWQAVKAWEFWWNIKPDVDVMYAALNKSLDKN